MCITFGCNPRVIFCVCVCEGGGGGGGGRYLLLFFVEKQILVEI